MLNAKTISLLVALASLVSLTRAAFAESKDGSQLPGAIIASGSISTANGGRVEAQRRKLADGSELSTLTEYDQAGTITRRLVSPETKGATDKSTTSVAKREPEKKIASNR